MSEYTDFMERAVDVLAPGDIFTVAEVFPHYNSANTTRLIKKREHACMIVSIQGQGSKPTEFEYTGLINQDGTLKCLDCPAAKNLYCPIPPKEELDPIEEDGKGRVITLKDEMLIWAREIYQELEWSILAGGKVTFETFRDAFEEIDDDILSRLYNEIDPLRPVYGYRWKPNYIKVAEEREANFNQEP